MILSLVLSEDEQFLANLKQLTGAYVYTLSELAAQVGDRPELEKPHVVFLRAAGPVEAIESVRSVRTEIPDALLVLSEDLDEPVRNLLVEAGVWEVLDRSSSLSDYQALLSRVPMPDFPEALEGEGVADSPGESAPEPEEEPVPETRVIAVVSPKGGVGKTSIATNLALALADRHPRQVVIVDLDLQFGDVCTQLDLYPRQTVEHAIEAAKEDDRLILKAVLTAHERGFHVVPGAVSPVTRDTITSEQLSRLIQQLALAFPYVIIDTGGGLDESTLVVLEEATAALFVSTLDISSARGLKKEIEILKQLSLLPKQQLFVVNKAERNLALRPKDLEDAIGFSVDVVIDREKEVSVAVNRGEPMLMTKPKSDFVKGIAAVADAVEKITPTVLVEGV